MAYPVVARFLLTTVVSVALPRVGLAIRFTKASAKASKLGKLGVSVPTVARIVSQRKITSFTVGKVIKPIPELIFEKGTRRVVNVFLPAKIEVPGIQQASEQLAEAVRDRRIIPLGGVIAAAFFGRKSVTQEIIRRALPNIASRFAFELFVLATS